jgi:phage replication-related protein YjqB (UPF0714/DUF867 family)
VFADLLAHPGIVEQRAIAGRVGFLALHGGLEQGTAEIARAAAERAGASWYALVQPPDLRWHVPSHHYEAATSPGLDEVLDHCEVVVSVHGYGRDDCWTTLLLGGRDRDLARALGVRLRAALPEYEVRDDLAAIPRELRGLDARNPVNRSRGGGVQLELPPRVRGMGPYWADFDGPAPVPHTAALVDGLVAFAAALQAGAGSR